MPRRVDICLQRHILPQGLRKGDHQLVSPANLLAPDHNGGGGHLATDLPRQPREPAAARKDISATCAASDRSPSQQLGESKGG